MALRRCIHCNMMQRIEKLNCNEITVPPAQKAISIVNLVIPCFNEEEVLPQAIEQLSQKVGRLRADELISGKSKIIFVDDGSKDATWEIIEYLSGITVPGWASIVCSLWGIGGMIVFSIGVIGEYIGKIYFETKHRPQFHVEQFLYEANDAA